MIINNIVYIDYNINIRFLFCESNNGISWKYPNLKQITGNVIFDMNDIKYANSLIKSGKVKKM